MADEFIIENIEWVLTLVFMAGGGWFMLKSLAAKIDNQTEIMDKRFDSLNIKDDVHDGILSNHETRISVNEARIQTNNGILSDMLKKIDTIYRMMLRDNKSD